MTEAQFIRDETDLRKYRHEIPNLVDDLGLSPFEYRLYGHYKRVGTCTESVRTTARKCGMSTGMVSETRESLVSKGLITAEITVKGTTIKVVDIWLENFARYSGKTIEQIQESLNKLRGKPDQQFGEIAQALEKMIGSLNTNTGIYIDAWKEDHETKWILAAIEIGIQRGARSLKYVDAILKGWKESGYPQPGKKPAQQQPAGDEIKRKVVEDVFGK